MIEQAIYVMLKNDAGVGTLTADRIYYVERPQGATYNRPAVVIQRGEEAQTHDLKGSSGRTSGDLRVTCLADSYLAAGDLARAVNKRLDGFTGHIEIKDADGNTINLRVRKILQESQSDIASDHRDGQGAIATHGIEIDYTYSHTNPS